MMKRRLEPVQRGGPTLATARRLVARSRTAGQPQATGLLTHLKLLVLWICLLAGDSLLELRLEHLYPLCLLLQTVYEGWRWQGVAPTLLFASATASTTTLLVAGLHPHHLQALATLSAFAQLSAGAPACLLLLPLVYYADQLLPQQHPGSRLQLATAGHCLGFPAVRAAFGVQEWVRGWCRGRVRADVGRKNRVLYELLQEALPPVVAEEKPESASSSMVEEKVQPRKARRRSVEEVEPQKQDKGNAEKNGSYGEKPPRARRPRDDCCLRAESELRKLKADLASAKLMEAELRGQLQAQSHCERGLRSELVALQSEHELLEGRHALLAQRAAEERAGLERRVVEERRAKETALGRVKKVDCPGDCRRRLLQSNSTAEQLKSDLRAAHEQLARAERELQNVKSTLLHEQSAKTREGAEVAGLQLQVRDLERSLNAETKLKLDLFGALGEARREVAVRDGLVRQREEELEEVRQQLHYLLQTYPPPTSEPASDPSDGAVKSGGRGFMD